MFCLPTHAPRPTALAATLAACGGAALLALSAPSSLQAAGIVTDAPVPVEMEMKEEMAAGDIIDVATGPGMQEVTTLVSAIKAAGLVEALKGDGPFTVFAPTNEAFAKLPAGTVETLLKPENKEKLQSILLYHVHEGDAVMAADVETMALSTLNGEPLAVEVTDDGVMVNDAKVIKTDVMASNGVIHWVDAVILPPM